MESKPRNSRSKPREHYIAQATAIHGDRYDYSGIPEWPVYTKPTTIGCPVHGQFEQKLSHHIHNKAGCPECGTANRAKNRRLGRERYIEKAREVHGDKYSYELWGDVSNADRVSIICPDHGTFVQSLNDHVSLAAGCPDCARLASSQIRQLKWEATIDYERQRRIYEVPQMTNPSKTHSQLKHKDEYIAQATAIHGDRYDYSLLDDYPTSTAKVKIICAVHGVFLQTLNSHISSKSGCTLCKRESRMGDSAVVAAVADATTSVEKFIARAKLVHGEVYDYSLWTADVKWSSVVEIGCPEHGPFTQVLGTHVRGSKCPKCAASAAATNRRKPKAHYVSAATAVHGDRYDYSLLPDFPTSTKKSQIICAVHGEFQQTLKDHITRGAGCPRCAANAKRVDSAVSAIRDGHETPLDAYIAQARAIHGDRYDYSSWTPDVSWHSLTEIVCPVHGPFTQRLGSHVSGRGCSRCGTEQTTARNTGLKAEYIEKAKAVHGDAYDYSEVQSQIGNAAAIEIRCPIHGPFKTTWNQHIQSKVGCPGCTDYQTSRGEREVRDFITSLGFEVSVSNRTIIAPKELDIVVPSTNLAIEYCGLYWHGSRFKANTYHLDKLEAANAKGFRLLTIFEDEWLFRRSIVEEKLRQILKMSSRTTVFARKCRIVELSRTQKNAFFDANHIQGSGPGSLTYGLEWQGTVVAAMTFIEKAGGRWDLNRYATSVNVPGGFSKLLRHFERNNEWTQIVSFADRRWSEGAVYTTQGFTLDNTLPPDYAYVVANKTLHKFNFRHRNLSRVLGDAYNPQISEAANMAAAGYDRIYNCGLLRYIKNKE